MIENIINTLFWVALALSFLWWVWHWGSRSGSLHVGNEVFDFHLGDNLDAGVATSNGIPMKFKGIDIHLDTVLPHIYLDSHRDSRISGPRFTIAREQRVSLEGNFDKYFYLYAADGYKQLALSIITPDVMQTLINSTSKFDVEIKGAHLRLISQRGIYRRHKREVELLAAAKPIMEEIVHRLSSWKSLDAKSLQASQLHIVPEQSFKLGKHSFRLAYLLCAFIGLFFSAGWLIATSAAGSKTGVQEMTNSARAMGAGICLLIPLSVLFGLEYWQRYSPRTYKVFFDRGK